MAVCESLVSFGVRELLLRCGYVVCVSHHVVTRRDDVLQGSDDKMIVLLFVFFSVDQPTKNG